MCCLWSRRGLMAPVRKRKGYLPRLCSQGQAVRTFIEGSPQLSVSAPAQTTVGATAVLALGANPKRKGLLIQNTGTTIIRVVLGSVDPTQAAYTFALSACTAADDGKGGSYTDSNWVGQVRVISSEAGGTFVLTEFE